MNSSTSHHVVLLIFRCTVKKSFDCTQYCWDKTATEFGCTNSNKALEGECMCLNSNYMVSATYQGN